MDLRCPHGIKFGELHDFVLEVKCRSSRCGAGSGVVVIHRFDALTGNLLDTQRFAEPPREGTQHDAQQHGAAVRSS